MCEYIPNIVDFEFVPAVDKPRADQTLCSPTSKKWHKLGIGSVLVQIAIGGMCKLPS